MQCPACKHEASLSEFGDPPQCPKCGAFYGKAVVTAHRRHLSALEAAKAMKASNSKPSGSATAWRRETVGGAVLAALTFVIIAIWSFQDRPPRISSEAPPATGSVQPRGSGSKDFRYHYLAEQAVKARLKDPDSATFRGQVIGRSGIPCGEVNSKNSFGGYSGFTRYAASGGGTVFFEEDLTRGEFQKVWNQLCR